MADIPLRPFRQIDEGQGARVGKGETQRPDKLRGRITCSYGRCEALTDGEAVIEKPADANRSDDADVPPPPPGFSIDTP